MGVKYKYPGEEEVILIDANSYTLEIDPTLITQWQALGTYFDVSSGEIGAFVSQIVTVNQGEIVEAELTTQHNQLVGYYWQLDIGN